MPLTGADVDTWGEVDVNPNMVAIDGLFGGIQTIAATGAAPITLTAPAGFTATPSPGPTQSQNRVLRFTGVLTAGQQVTLPLPGVYVIENLTTGNFVLYFRGAVAGTEVISVDQGARQTIYNDGSNVRFVDMPRVGSMELWAGITGLPLWAVNCTIKPYLVCDGAVYNFSDFPYLGAKLGSNFGGNGSTTFGVPDLRGRAPLAYDSTGVRITVSGSGINGLQLGSAGGSQSVTMDASQIPSHFHAAGIYDAGHGHILFGQNYGNGGSNSTPVIGVYRSNNNDGTLTSLLSANVTGVRVNSSNGLDTTYSAGGGAAHNNMPPAQVAGIWVIKT